MLSFIPIETKDRDLDARLFLAYNLVINGFQCVLGRKTYVHELMFKQKIPYVYISKGMARSVYKKLKETGGKFVVLDEEGGIYKKDDDMSLKIRNDDEVLKHVDLYFSWGQKQKDFLIQNRKNIPGKYIYVTGQPRFDMCSSTYNDYFKALFKKKHKRLVNDGYILINTNFSVYNHQLDINDFIVYHKTFFEREKKNTKDSKNKENSISNMMSFNYEKKVYEKFLDAIQTLSRRFPDKDIVIRPHPIEQLKTYTTIFKDYENVHVIREGSSLKWNQFADVVIHHDCTTGVEAMILGKPTISYTPLLEEDQTSWLPVAAGFRVNNLEELISIIKNHVIHNYDPEYFKDKYKFDMIKEYIANTEFSSVKQIVHILKEKKKAWEAKDGKLAYILPRFNYKNILDKIYSIKNFIFNKFKNSYEKNTMQLKNNKFDKLSHKEIIERLNLLKKIDNKGLEINVKKLRKDTFLISTANVNKDNIK